MKRIKNNRVSVLIATYNRFESLRDTIQSVLNQERDQRFDYEVIVVDNNSKDRTKETILSFKEKFNGLVQYHFEPRQGKSFALNRGIAEARGSIIAFTDDDCLVDRQWLKNIYDVFSRKEIDLLAGKVIPVFNTMKPVWLDLDAFRGVYVNIDGGDQFIEGENIPCAGANLSIRRVSCDRFGVFVSRRRGQDIEFFNNWQRGGARIAYSPDVKVQHRTPDSRVNKSYVRRWYFLAGRNYAQAVTEGKIPVGTGWIYKRFFLRLGAYLKGLLYWNKNNFVNEVHLLQSAGSIAGLWGIKLRNEDLR